MRGSSARSIAPVVALVVALPGLLGACAGGTAASTSPSSSDVAGTSAALTTPEPSPSAASTSATASTSDTIASTDTSTSSTSITSTTSTSSTTPTDATVDTPGAGTSTTVTTDGDGPGSGELRPADYPNVAAAVFMLAPGNVAVSVSVHRDGVEPWGLAAGYRVDGTPVDADTPFVTASVSKLITALSIARLVERGDLAADDAVPWDDLGLAHDPLWADVTVRELLDHTSGMPVNRRSWLDDPGPCSVPLQELLLEPPTIARTTWRYSNGNYCALGLLVSELTGRPLDEAADELVFGPAGVTGPYLADDGLSPRSAPSPRGVRRLLRLGGAGTWIASTDDVAAVLADITPVDLEVLRWPGIIVDQYGWGHTGTVDGAKACAWVLEGGRTTVAAVVAGPEPATGGDLCDAVLPALALDLGIWAGEPIRNPI